MLPATETFTNSNDTDLASHSASWTKQNTGSLSGGMWIQSNACAPNTSGGNTASYFWNADSFDNDHYSTATVVAVAAGAFIGMSVRNTSGGNAYTVNTDTLDQGYLEKYISGSWTALTSGGATLSSSDVLLMEAEGTTIRHLINGSPDMSTTDSSLSTGAPGVSGYNSGGAPRIDNWEGDNLGGGPPSYPIPESLHAYRQRRL